MKLHICVASPYDQLMVFTNWVHAEPEGCKVVSVGWRPTFVLDDEKHNHNRRVMQWQYLQLNEL